MSTSRLDQLLARIHPTRTMEEINRRADEAFNDFPQASSQMGTWDAFRSNLVCFLHHVEHRLLRLARPVSGGMDFDWGRCCQLLMRAYGSNGEKTSFEMARTGNEGGLMAVQKAMAQMLVEQYMHNEISALISTFWNNLSVNERLAATEEYLAKYGHLLPSELTEGSAARVKGNFLKVLEDHVGLMQRLAQIGRS